MKKIGFMIAIVAMLGLVFVLGSCSGNGLEFEKGENGYYVVGRGSNTDTDLAIPDKYLLSPVVGIQAEAFKGCTDIKSVILPDTIESIGASAFDSCTSLESINTPANLNYIGSAAFLDCTALQKFDLHDEIGTVWYNAFNGTSICEKIDGVSYLGDWAMTINSKVEEVTLREGTVRIAYRPFMNYDKQTINLPKSIKKIHLSTCYTNKTFNYPGTVSQWKDILTNDAKNLSPVDCTVICTDGTLTYRQYNPMP